MGEEWREGEGISRLGLGVGRRLWLPYIPHTPPIQRLSLLHPNPTAGSRAGAVPPLERAVPGLALRAASSAQARARQRAGPGTGTTGAGQGRVRAVLFSTGLRNLRAIITKSTSAHYMAMVSCTKQALVMEAILNFV